MSLALLSAPHGVALAVRAISAGDENHLLPIERALFATSRVADLRRSGAARRLARDLIFAEFGLENAPIGRGSNRAPIWPEGLVGSLAHDDIHCAAAVARAATAPALGVDIEPDEPLDEALVPIVANAAERRRYAPEFLRSRTLFVAKEATFKATNPLDGCFLEFHDIDVDMEAERATTSTGRVVRFQFSRHKGLLALAIPV